NHFLSADVNALGPAFVAHADVLAGRSVLVRKAKVVPVECVVRGYLAGSGWKEYQQHHTVCGIALPAGLKQCEQLPAPVFTPDSSRFWPADEYRPGSNPSSFDKQFVRDWLEASGWDKNSPPPELPREVVERTRAKYLEAYERLTASKLG